MSEFFEGGEEGKKAFAQKLGAALEEIGFAALTGHGVDPRLYAEAEEKVADLFENSSIEERLKYEA